MQLRVAHVLAVVLFLSAQSWRPCAALDPHTGHGHSDADGWWRSAHAPGSRFRSRPAALDGHHRMPGFDPAQRRVDEHGHVHYEHAEWRMNAAGKRSHYRYSAVQTGATFELDRVQGVAAVHCALAPDLLSVVLADPADGANGHEHARKLLRPGMIVVGSEHWGCGEGPSVEEPEYENEFEARKYTREGPTNKVKTGLMVKILELHVHTCVIPVTVANSELQIQMRGTCVDIKGEQAVLTDIFKDVTLSFVTEDLHQSEDHDNSRRIPRHVYHAHGPVRGHTEAEWDAFHEGLARKGHMHNEVPRHYQASHMYRQESTLNGPDAGTGPAREETRMAKADDTSSKGALPRARAPKAVNMEKVNKEMEIANKEVKGQYQNRGSNDQERYNAYVQARIHWVDAENMDVSNLLAYEYDVPQSAMYNRLAKHDYKKRSEFSKAWDYAINLGKTMIGFVKDVVHELGSLAKQVIHFVVELPVTILKGINTLAGGALQSVVDGAAAATKLVEYGLDAAVNSVEAQITNTLDLVSLGLDAMKCIGGDCEVTFRKPTYGVNFNFNEYLHKQEKKFEKIDLDFTIEGRKSGTKAEGGVNLSGKISLDPQELYFWMGAGFKFQIKMKNYDLKLISMTKYAGVKISAQVLVSISITMQVYGQKPIWDKDWDFSIWLGPVQIVIKPQVVINVGIYGDIFVNWNQVLGVRIEAGFELGLKYENKKLGPVAGWMDGKFPSIKLPEIVAPDQVYMNCVIQVQPEANLQLGLEGFTFLRFEVLVALKFGLTMNPVGKSNGIADDCPGGMALWIGIIPTIAAHLQVHGLVKLPASAEMDYTLASHDFNRNSNIWAPKIGDQFLDHIDLFNSCRSANDDSSSAIGSGSKASFMRIISRKQDSFEFGWDFPAAKIFEVNIVSFRVELDDLVPKPVYFPGTKAVMFSVPTLWTKNVPTAAGPMTKKRFTQLTNVQTYFQGTDNEYWELPMVIQGDDDVQYSKDACRLDSGLVLLVDTDIGKAMCQALDSDVQNPKGYTAFFSNVNATKLRSSFSASFTGLLPDKDYGVSLAGMLMDGTLVEIDSKVTVHTLSPPAPPPTDLAMVEILADSENAGRFAASLKWKPNPNVAKPAGAFFQVLVKPTRQPLARPQPCAEGFRRVNFRSPVSFKGCEAIPGYRVSSDFKNAVSSGFAAMLQPPAQSAPVLDYIPTVTADQTTLLVRGLTPGLVYYFEVAHMLPVKDSTDEFAPGNPSAQLKLQMPGLPAAGFINASTSLPFDLKVARLRCGVFNVTFSPAKTGFGGAVAVLAKSVVLKYSDDIGGNPKYLTIDKIQPLKPSYSVPIDVSSIAKSIRKTVMRKFVLSAATSAGFSPDAEASNTVTVVDQPCVSDSCALWRLDDVLLDCPDPKVSLTTFDEDAVDCSQKAGNDIACIGSDPIPIARRNLLSADSDTVHSLPFGRRLLQVDSDAFSDTPPPAAGPDADFRITDPLPIDPTLARAAEAAYGPTNATAIELPIAGAYRAADLYMLPDEDLDPNSAIAKMQADVNRAALRMASRPKNSTLRRYVNTDVDVDLSRSLCPPDSKISAALGRTQRDSLCAYQVTGYTKVCGVSSSHALQFLFTAPRSALYRFDSSASAFPTIIDLRSYDANGSCDPLVCTRTFYAGVSGLEAATQVSAVTWYLRQGADVAVNVAADAGGCASGPVVLDIALDMPYDDHVLVYTAIVEKTTFNASTIDPISGSGLPPPVAVLSSIGEALEYASWRIAARTATRPIQIGIYLMAGSYFLNGTAGSGWSVPQTAAGAGSTIWVRSLSGTVDGPKSAADTFAICPDASAAFVFGPDNGSPRVLPMGLSIANCSGSYADATGAVQTVPPITVRGTADVTLRNLALASNLNTGGPGGAIVVRGGASVTISGCAFMTNRGTGAGGALAILEGSLATVVGCAFSRNALSPDVDGSGTGGAVVVMQSTALFTNCTFRENSGRTSGGALAAFGSNVTVIDAKFQQNTASVRGGAILLLDGSSFRCVRTLFLQNQAPVGGALGAGTEIGGSAGRVAFEGCSFRSNQAISADLTATDRTSYYGGALALFRSSETVTIRGAVFDANRADGASAIFATTPFVLLESSLTSGLGDAIFVNNTSAELTEVTVAKHAYVLALDINVGGALTCVGASASLRVTSSTFRTNFGVGHGGAVLVRSGCTAVFTTSRFEGNKGLTGGGVAVGVIGDPSADAAGASFVNVGFTANAASPYSPVDPLYGGPNRGFGGGLAIFGCAAPVSVSGCIFVNNTAFAGAGIFASSSLQVTGQQSVFIDNQAGYPWFDNDDSSDQQNGGGILIMPAAVQMQKLSFEIWNSLFSTNIARGMFGGGIAIFGSSSAMRIFLNGTQLINNFLLSDDGQGGGLFVAEAMPEEGSDFISTGNVALGAYPNAFFGGELKAIADSYAQDPTNKNPKNKAPFKSCFGCTPCQKCQPKTGRCVFPADLDNWCQLTGSCNKDVCSYVQIGDAQFDSTTSFQTIRIDFDFPYGVSTSTSGSAVECSSLFVPDSAKLLGTGALCSIQSANRSRALRQSGTTTRQVVINLGPGFSVAPGTMLTLDGAGLPSQYGDISSNPVVQIAMAAVPTSVLQKTLAQLNTTGSTTVQILLQQQSASKSKSTSTSTSAAHAGALPGLCIITCLAAAAVALAEARRGHLFALAALIAVWTLSAF